MKISKVIGFAKEYYTLWNVVSIDRYETIDGVRTLVSTTHNYTYIKNLSMDMNKSIEKVQKQFDITNPEVDDSLRGVTAKSFSRYQSRIMSYNVFPFGKLKDEPILLADDVFQLNRVFIGVGHIGGDKEFDTLIPTKRRVLARRRLIQLGELVRVGKEWLTKGQIEQRKIIANSRFVFNDGERVTLEIKFVSKKWFETAFGITYILTFTDENGNIFTYRGANPPDIEDKDATYVIKATIKHNEYKGIKQNLIQRILVLESCKV